MPQIDANGINLEYESFGSARAEAVLLIQGLGGQLIHWPVELCHELVARRYRVIRFDNRDTGLSTKFGGALATGWLQSLATGVQDLQGLLPYTLDDMARDAVGLLRSLGIARAHVAGASMGGMVAQVVAADHPDRTLSLTSIMSSSGRPDLPGARPEVAAAMMAPYPPAGDAEAIVARSMRLRRAVAGSLYPVPEDEMRRLALLALRRCYYPPGIVRHYAAVLASGDRRRKLARITAPAVVLHGDDDPLIPVEAGIDTAHSIPGAELRIVPGMGHDLPVGLTRVIADAIDSAAVRARVPQR